MFRVVAYQMPIMFLDHGDARVRQLSNGQDRQALAEEVAQDVMMTLWRKV